MEAGGGEGRQGGGGGGVTCKIDFLSFFLLLPLLWFSHFVTLPGVEREYVKKGNRKRDRRLGWNPLETARVCGSALSSPWEELLQLFSVVV